PARGPADEGAGPSPRALDRLEARRETASLCGRAFGDLPLLAPTREVRYPSRGRTAARPAPNTGGMSVADLEITVETETERVARWRVEELERAGYDAAQAQVLAQRTEVDLHRAVDLVVRGCAPELALR